MVERFARDPSVDVDKLQRLLDMREQIAQREREDRFSEAMAAAQAEVRAVTKDARNDQTRSKYATYAQIDKTIRPVYAAHGFSLSFDTQDTPKENMVRVLCYVRHASGFQQTYSITMPADGKGPRGNDVMTRTHATGSAVSYGMRYLVRMIFNVPESEDDDGNAAGQRYAPPRPAPNPVYPPHDPVTGEIYENDPVSPQQRRSAVEGAAPVARSDSAGAAVLTVEVVDRLLTEGAAEGMAALREAFLKLPSDWQRIVTKAVNTRHKPLAAAVDAEREATSQMDDR